MNDFFLLKVIQQSYYVVTIEQQKRLFECFDRWSCFSFENHIVYVPALSLYIDFMAIISVSLHISMFGCGFIIELRHFKVNKSKIHRYNDLVAVDVLLFFCIKWSTH